MSKKSINLVYSSNKSNFFAIVKEIRGQVLNFKSELKDNGFATKDEIEISRGLSYAVLPQLIERGENNQITTQIFIDELKNAGVKDDIFQQKILSLLLQSRAGIHYGIVGAVNALFLNHNYQYLVSNDSFKLKLEVKNGKKVRIIADSTIINLEQEKCFGVHLEIDITPKRVCINKLQITKKFENNNDADNAFSLLEKNKANILQMFIIFIKRLFNADSNMEIENEKKDKYGFNGNKNTEIKNKNKNKNKNETENENENKDKGFSVK